MTIREALQGKARDSEILLSFVLKKNKAWLFANPDFKVPNLQLKTYNSLIHRRASRWPIAYLTGHKEFYGLDFKVDKNVLIPRPETELLVELALKGLRVEGTGYRNIIDVGTGSGAIIISIVKFTKSKATFFATDILNTALKVAKSNARRHGVAKKIKFIKSDLLSNLQLTTHNSPTLIIANLPYLTPRQMKNPDLKHEPKNALVAGKGGLKYYRELFKQMAVLRHPRPDRGSRLDSRLRGNDATLLLEHDPSQVAKLKSLAKKYFPKAKPIFHKDLSNRYRVVEILID